MTFALVLLFWLAVIGYVPFHFRKTKALRSFMLGFTAVWYAAATATVPDEDEWMGDDADMDCGERGAITGIVSMVIAGIAVLVFAGFTLYWAL